MKKKILTVVLVILGIIALLVVIGLIVFHNYYSKLNYDDGTETKMTLANVMDEGNEDVPVETDSPQEVIDEANIIIEDIIEFHVRFERIYVM